MFTSYIDQGDEISCLQKAVWRKPIRGQVSGVIFQDFNEESRPDIDPDYNASLTVTTKSGKKYVMYLYENQNEFTSMIERNGAGELMDSKNLSYAFGIGNVLELERLPEPVLTQYLTNDNPGLAMSIVMDLASKVFDRTYRGDTDNLGLVTEISDFRPVDTDLFFNKASHLVITEIPSKYRVSKKGFKLRTMKVGLLISLTADPVYVGEITFATGDEKAAEAIGI